MSLATVDAEGLPDARMVLCKQADERGLVFYTNIESAKGRELAAPPKAAALFHWKSLRRQARFRGSVALIPEADADAYYHSRPRVSQIGAWASQQSRALEVARLSRGARRRVLGQIRRGRNPPPGLLARLPADADRDRILEGRRVPSARPGRLRPRGRGLARRRLYP